MDCFGTCFTHAQTSDVKLPCKRPRSPLQRWRQPLSSPLRAPLKPLQAPFKPPWSLPKVKPPWSPLQAPLKPPSSPLQASRSPLHLRKASSPLEAVFEAPFKPPWSLPKVKPPSRPFKPPWSPLQAPFKPLWSPLEAFRRWSPLRPSDLRPPPPWPPDPSSLLEGGFWRGYLGTSPKVPPTTNVGRHSPSACQRCTWTPSGRGESAPSGKHHPLGLSTRSVAVFQELCKETIGSCCYIHASTDIGETSFWCTRWSHHLRPVLVWRLSSYYLLRLGWVSSVGGEGKASINSQHKNKLPKKKRPMRGRGLQLLSPERNRFASSWAHWTCEDW